MTTLAGHALRAIHSHVLALAAALTLFATPAIFSSAHAQTVPTNCRPSGGPNYDCAANISGPYTYQANTCGSQSMFPSEAAAFAVYRTLFASDPCPVTFETLGYVYPGPKYTPQDFLLACAGYPSGTPGWWYGQEQSNWLLERVTSENGPPPACGNPQDSVWGAVKRSRSFSCPEGYSRFTSDVCYRGTTQLDHAKNYGQSCPPNGQCTTKNPINLGAKNKFRAERDYSEQQQLAAVIHAVLQQLADECVLFAPLQRRELRGPCWPCQLTHRSAQNRANRADDSRRLRWGLSGSAGNIPISEMFTGQTSTLLTSAFAFPPRRASARLHQDVRPVACTGRRSPFGWRKSLIPAESKPVGR